MKKRFLPLLLLFCLLWTLGTHALATRANSRPSQADAASHAAAIARSFGDGLLRSKLGQQFDPLALAFRTESIGLFLHYLSGKATSPDIALPSPRPTLPTTKPDSTPNGGVSTSMPKLIIEVGSQHFSATLVDNPSTRALLEQLPLSINMDDLNGNEKFYYLQSPLPTQAQTLDRIQNGDLLLYGSDCLVLFYESFSSSYRYTRLGSLDQPVGLFDAVGSGHIDVTLRSE